MSGLSISLPERTQLSIPQPERRIAAADLENLARLIEASSRPLIVCGPQDDDSFAAHVLKLARMAGAPVLADPLSGLRTGGTIDDNVIDSYDLVLRSSLAREHLSPDLVIRFGMTPISKMLLTFIDCDCHQVSIRFRGLPNDPTQSASVVWDADGTDVARRLATLVRGQERSGEWMSQWKISASEARRAVQAELGTQGLSEPAIAAVLAEQAEDGDLLWIGNSMPIRDVDGFFESRPMLAQMLGNRGVNGIDGVVSSAMGAAASAGKRVVLLIGDLSFHHDLNGLLAAFRFGLNATIVLVNNDGGGIFNFLPQREYDELFEDFFATPLGLNFEPLVRAFGGDFVRPETTAEFVDVFARSRRKPGMSVIEVKGNRELNLRQHEVLWSAGVSAVERSLQGRQS